MLVRGRGLWLDTDLSEELVIDGVNVAWGEAHQAGGVHLPVDDARVEEGAHGAGAGHVHTKCAVCHHRDKVRGEDAMLSVPPPTACNVAVAQVYDVASVGRMWRSAGGTWQQVWGNDEGAIFVHDAQTIRLLLHVVA